MAATVELAGAGVRAVRVKRRRRRHRRVPLLLGAQRRNTYWLFRNANVQIARGECVFLMDESGERASSLMRLMTGLVQPDAGTARRRGGGLLLTRPNRRWVASLSIRQAVQLLGGLYGMTDAQIGRDWSQWADFAEVGDILGKPVEEVDSAVLRQIAFAVGTAAPVRLLGLEHMALAGPPEFRAKCVPRLRQLTQSGTSLVIVQDKPDLISLLADRALLVKRNALVELTAAEATDLARKWVSHRRRVRKKSKRAMFEDDDDDDII